MECQNSSVCACMCMCVRVCNAYLEKGRLEKVDF